MNVTELNADQLNVLRSYYNYEVNNSTALTDENEIPNSVLYSYYAGIDFVPGDFGSEEEEAASDFWRITNEPEQLPALPQVITI